MNKPYISYIKDNNVNIDDLYKLTDNDILTYYWRCVCPNNKVLDLANRFIHTTMYIKAKNELKLEIRKQKLSKLCINLKDQ